VYNASLKPSLFLHKVEVNNNIYNLKIVTKKNKGTNLHTKGINPYLDYD